MKGKHVPIDCTRYSKCGSFTEILTELAQQIAYAKAVVSGDTGSSSDRRFRCSEYYFIWSNRSEVDREHYIQKQGMALISAEDVLSELQSKEILNFNHRTSALCIYTKCR